MQNPDDFLYDKVFQPTSEYTDVEYDINHNLLASFFYKATAMFMIVTSYVEYFWNDKSAIIVFVFGYMATEIWKLSVRVSKRSMTPSGTQSSSRIDTGNKFLRYFLTFGILYMVIVKILYFFSMMPLWVDEKFTDISVFTFCVYVALWAAEYFESCYRLPPSVKQARQARKLTVQTA